MRKRDELTDPASCMSRARDDEWTFVLLGRDPAAPAAIRAWIEERIRLGKNAREDAQIVSAEQWIASVQAEHGVGVAPGFYRVISGDLAGARLFLHFVNHSGNADCRFAEDFGPHRAGEVVALSPERLATEQE